MHKQAYKQIVGWDVGGAHLKATLLTDGKLQQVLQIPCALWRGLHELETAVECVISTFGLASEQALHAITMTGELVDLFENRQHGVIAISNVMEAKLSGKKLFYAGRSNPQTISDFVNINEVAKNWHFIASANWLASASYMANELEKQHISYPVLLIDIGSTTTDFIAIKNGEPQCLAFNDAKRLQTEELVYTGMIRTPLMAVSQKVIFKGLLTSLAAEYFATIADVYRITGDLDEADDMADTADGKEKTLEASTCRLARMIGHDARDEDFAVWKDLANEFKRLQLSRLIAVAKQHIARMGSIEDIIIVGAGVGSFLVKEIAAQLGVPYQDSTLMFSHLFELINEQPSMERNANVCLPAYAVAYLAWNNRP